MIAHNLKTFFKRYIFYKNDFKNRLEDLREFASLLDDNNIDSYLVGGFSIFLLEKRLYRKSWDIDLTIDTNYRERLLDILEKKGVEVMKRPQYGTYFFKLKDTFFDVHFHHVIDDIMYINYIYGFEDKWGNVELKIPKEHMIDERFPSPFNGGSMMQDRKSVV